MVNHPNRGRTYEITLTWTRDRILSAFFQKQTVRCHDDAEALRTATALVRFLQLDRAKSASAQVLTAARREVGRITQEGVRVMETRGAEFQP